MHTPWYYLACIAVTCLPFLFIIWTVDYTIEDEEEVEFDADDDHHNHTME